MGSEWGSVVSGAGSQVQTTWYLQGSGRSRGRPGLLPGEVTAGLCLGPSGL